jgi:hypothetical protein
MGYSHHAEAGRWIVYAPIRQAAFIANSAIVNFIADLQNGEIDARSRASVA